MCKINTMKKIKLKMQSKFFKTVAETLRRTVGSVSAPYLTIMSTVDIAVWDRMNASVHARPSSAESRMMNFIHRR